ncbi:MAG TPA: hypothetical protein VFN10_08290 [Thermoanaerobaculia bacterium]|nr:hypothetical protein [Thermoanaerobaculia bacterium]
MIPLLLALVTVTFRPAAPTVGDPITVTFTQPVKLDASPAFEIVSSKDNVAVVRTFEPKPIALSGVVGDTRFRNLMLPVKSVLKQGDDLKPAPLAPPIAIPAPQLPLYWIAGALIAAIIAWTLVWWRTRVRAATRVPALAPDERFRRAVLALRGNASMRHRWAALADATRAYLAATRALGTELTSTELVARWPDELVRLILRQGDLEKFSTRGAEPLEFDSVADRVLAYAEPRQP